MGSLTLSPWTRKCFAVSQDPNISSYVGGLPFLFQSHNHKGRLRRMSLTLEGWQRLGRREGRNIKPLDQGQDNAPGCATSAGGLYFQRRLPSPTHLTPPPAPGRSAIPFPSQFSIHTPSRFCWQAPTTVPPARVGPGSRDPIERLFLTLNPIRVQRARIPPPLPRALEELAAPWKFPGGPATFPRQSHPPKQKKKSLLRIFLVPNAGGGQ